MEHRARATRLDALDGLRGIAILLVVAYHAQLVYGFATGIPVVDGVIKTGFLGVELFFALSGFCMFYPFARAHFAGKSPPTWRHYAGRRIAKIVPSYVVVLGIFAALYADRLGANLWPALLTHLAFVHPFFDREFTAISGPFWTIGVEVQFYFVFPLLCGLLLRRPAVAAVAVIAAAGAYRLAIALAGLGTTFLWTSQLPGYLDIFAAGVFAAYVVAWCERRTPEVPRRMTTAVAVGAAAVAVGGMVALASSAAMQGGDAFFAWEINWRFPIAALLFTMIGASALAAPAWSRVLATPVLTFLAVISYNLYLWQLEVLVQANSHGIALPLAVAGSIAIAAAVTYLFERPILAGRPLGWRPGAAANPAPGVGAGERMDAVEPKTNHRESPHPAPALVVHPDRRGASWRHRDCAYR